MYKTVRLYYNLQLRCLDVSGFLVYCMNLLAAPLTSCFSSISSMCEAPDVDTKNL